MATTAVALAYVSVEFFNESYLGGPETDDKTKPTVNGVKSKFGAACQIWLLEHLSQ